MTTVEYERLLCELNSKQSAEIAPLHNEMERILKEKVIIDQQRDMLRTKSSELGNRYYSLCEQAKSIKQKYKEKKNEVYIQKKAEESNELQNA